MPCPTAGRRSSPTRITESERAGGEGAHFPGHLPRRAGPSCRAYTVSVSVGSTPLDGTVLLPGRAYTLPSSVSCPDGKRDATFFLTVDIAYLKANADKDFSRRSPYPTRRVMRSTTSSQRRRCVSTRRSCSRRRGCNPALPPTPARGRLRRPRLPFCSRLSPEIVFYEEIICVPVFCALSCACAPWRPAFLPRAHRRASRRALPAICRRQAVLLSGRHGVGVVPPYDARRGAPLSRRPRPERVHGHTGRLPRGT